MRPTLSASIAAVLAICVLALPLLGLLWQQPQPARRSPLATRVKPASPATPAEAALRDAKRLWNRTQMAITPEQEALAEADPHAGTETAHWRQSLMARDEGGRLQRAAGLARRAVQLAQNPEEKYEATLWLALIECDGGYHAEELRQARRLVDLRPGSTKSLGALRRAAICNGMWDLARQADEILKVAEGDPGGDEMPGW